MYFIHGPPVFSTLGWKDDNASESVQKFIAKPTMAVGGVAPQLTPHLAHYNMVPGAVMCPATAYWHALMRDTMLKIVNELGFDGVHVWVLISDLQKT